MQALVALVFDVEGVAKQQAVLPQTARCAWCCCVKAVSLGDCLQIRALSDELDLQQFGARVQFIFLMAKAYDALRYVARHARPAKFPLETRTYPFNTSLEFRDAVVYRDIKGFNRQGAS